MTDKGAFECRAVELLLEATKLFPKGVISSYTPDPPDVQIFCDTTVVGVEVRKLFADESRKKGSLSRRTRSFQEQLVKRASEIYLQRSTEALYISLGFSQDLALRKHETEIIASAIVDSVISAGPELNEYGELRVKEAVPDLIAFLTVRRLTGLSEPVWNLHQTFWIQSTAPDLIQSALNAKEDRFVSFPDKFQHRWILLVCDGSTQPSALSLPPDLQAVTFYSSYNRGFILDMSARVAELTLRHPGHTARN